MSAEWLCFRECLRFSRRHRRYFTILLLLYGASLRHWRKMRAARFGYAFLQQYDDLMDGDRDSSETPDRIAITTQAEWSRGDFSGKSTLSRLGAAFHEVLETADEAKQDTAVLLELMHNDAARRLERRISSEAELEIHLQRTFHHSVNLLFHGCGLRTRATEAPALVAALAWCSVVRDFADDAEKGLINVPREVTGNPDATTEVAEMPEVKAWLDRQRALGPGLLDACESEREAVARTDPQAARLIGVFARSMRKYCRDAL